MKLIDILNDWSLLTGKKLTDTIALECDYCSTKYEKVVDLVKRNARRSKTGKAYCSDACRNNSQFILVEVECENCKIKFYRNPHEIKKVASGRQFCSRKCRATKMNWHILAKTRHCKGCGNTYKQPPNSGRTNKYCLDCTNNGIGIKTAAQLKSVKGLTIQQFADRIGQDKKSKRVRGDIAKMCRGWNRHLIGTPCQVCGYSKIVEFCHIKAVKDFSENDTLGTINDESNIFMLCPTHHAELDRGILKAEDVPARKLLTNEVEIEYNI